VDRNALSYLNEVNQSMDDVFAMLDKLAEYPELQKDDFIVLGAHFREHLSNANMAVLNALEESEEEEMMTAYRKRVAFERQLRDPDDCYLEVARREEERREQGLPSLIGVQRGMRRITREEIVGEPFADDEIEEDDTKNESELDEEQP
jgi:hypothetical protein